MIQTASYTNIGGRPQNEDSVRIVEGPQGICAVVADGLGGHGGGEIASKAVVNVVCDGWKGEADPEGLRSLVLKANQAVKDCQTRECSMKSTVVALQIRGNRIAWAHDGDSRLYRFKNGRWDFQTRDHSASQIAVMLGEITVDQIRFHEDRSRVIRALGQEEDLKVDTAVMDLAPGKYAFLLCSDGFWEYVLEPEMEKDLQAARDPQDWIDRMRRRLALRIPKDNDNNTAAAIWLELR